MRFRGRLKASDGSMGVPECSRGFTGIPLCFWGTHGLSRSGSRGFMGVLGGFRVFQEVPETFRRCFMRFQGFRGAFPEGFSGVPWGGGFQKYSRGFMGFQRFQRRSGSIPKGVRGFQRHFRNVSRGF